MKKVLWLIALVLTLTLVGCKNTISPTSSAPTLPTVATMEIPAFGAGSAKIAVAPISAYGIASTSVAYWTVGVSTALVTPKILFWYVHQVGTATPLTDGTGFKWVVTDTSNGNTATLVGKIENDSVSWSMTVTTDKLTVFTWFTGRSTVTGSAGSWTFYDTTKVNGVNPAYIKFTYVVGSFVKVEVVKVGSVDFGNYLKWENNGVNSKVFTGYTATPPKTVVITWNPITKEGSINVVGDKKYCWDASYNDITCP